VDRFKEAKVYRSTRRVLLCIYAILYLALPCDSDEDKNIDQPSLLMINEMEHEDTIKKEEEDDDKVFDEAVDGDDDSIGSDSQTSLHVENEAKDATTKADNNMTEAKDTTEANDSDTSNAMSEIVAVLKSARRALEVWILLLVAIETGDGLLQLKSIQAIAPLLPVSNRTNYSVLVARTLVTLLGSKPNMALRNVWEFGPGARMFPGGPVHALDAQNLG